MNGTRSGTGPPLTMHNDNLVDDDLVPLDLGTSTSDGVGIAFAVCEKLIATSVRARIRPRSKGARIDLAHARPACANLSRRLSFSRRTSRT